MDNSKRIDDFTEKYSVFEVNYDGVFCELPLRYEYGKFLSLKLSNSNRMSYSEMLDTLVYKLECEIRGLFYYIHTNSLERGLTLVEACFMGKRRSLFPYLRTPPLKPRRKSIEFQGKNLYADFLHANCVADHFDALDYWNYEDVYFSGCFDVGGSNTWCDWIDKRMGYDDRSLSDISKAEFSKEALLDDGGSSSTTSLSFVLKRKSKSRVKFTRKRAILKRSKMRSLRKDVCDDEPQLATQLSQTGGSSNNDFKDAD
ncbi:hypothetical protein Tco_0459908 [Tanacetum coccineum]